MKEDYIKRVNRILVFIDQNLDNDLSLEKISSIGFYSPFHLHRIFKSLIGETLNSYITRKRIEKTAAMLMHRKEITVSEISLLFGFNSNSSFTRTFKKFYGISPSQFRELSPSQYSKISKTESKNGQASQLFEEYICNINNLKNWIKMNAKIEIKQLPQMDFAYITQIGVDGLEDAFGRLFKWAGTKRLLDNPNCKVARIYHDSFKITAPDKVRMSVGIILDEKVEISGEIALTTIKAGKFIIGHFEIEPKDFEKSWSSLYVWMNENGYQKANANPLEVIYNNFNEHPQKKCVVDLHIPIL